MALQLFFLDAKLPLAPQFKSEPERNANDDNPDEKH